MNKRKQLLGILLGFIIIISVIFSTQYISSHKNHVCSGPHNCFICGQLHSAETFLKCLRSAIVAFSSYILSSYIFLSPLMIRKVLRCQTLVSLKVKLND